VGVYVTFYLSTSQGTRGKMRRQCFVEKRIKKTTLDTPSIFLSFLLSLCQKKFKAILSRSSFNTLVILENQATINVKVSDVVSRILSYSLLIFFR
jgi:hypothetical protein